MASRVNMTNSQIAAARPSPSICTIPLEILGNVCYTGFAGGMTTMQIFFFTLIVLALFVAVYWDGSL